MKKQHLNIWKFVTNCKNLMEEILLAPFIDWVQTRKINHISMSPVKWWKAYRVHGEYLHLDGKIGNLVEPQSWSAHSLTSLHHLDEWNTEIWFVTPKYLRVTQKRIKLNAAVHSQLYIPRHGRSSISELFGNLPSSMSGSWNICHLKTLSKCNNLLSNNQQ